MKHVEAVIKMFDPAYDVRRISLRRRNRSNRWYKGGTMFRAVLDTLKAAEGPLTVREIARRMLAQLGQAEPDLKTLRDLEGGIRSSLSLKEGKIVQNVGQGMPAQWALKARKPETFRRGTPVLLMS
jgi:hypothetical protein